MIMSIDRVKYCYLLIMTLFFQTISFRRTSPCFHAYGSTKHSYIANIFISNNNAHKITSLMMSSRHRPPSTKSISTENERKTSSSNQPSSKPSRTRPRPQSSSTSSKRYVPGSMCNQEDNDAAASNKPTNPWKQVIKQLETTTPTKNSMGKIVKAVDNDVSIIRDELQCKHFDTCGGCSVNVNFTSIPTVKKAQLFFATEGIKNFPIHIYDHIGWRSHVKLAVQPLSKWGGLKIGLYKPGTHNVEPMPDCRVHHPRINEAIEVIRAEATSLGVKGYQHGGEKADTTGELRYIQLSLERSTGKVQLVLVWNVVTYKDAQQTLPRLVKRLKGRPDLFHSITANFQTSRGNAIFNFNAKNWNLLWGPPVLKEQIGEAMFTFRPQIFRQANLDAFEKGIIPAVLKHVPVNSVVAELYSGIGVLGLNAASKCKAVFCSDSSEFVDDVFDACVDSLPEEHRGKVFYENLPAADAVAAGQCDEVDMLIVDPPRKGLDAAVLNLLLDKHETRKAENLKRLVYVSCGYDALERDTRALLESGLWKIRAIEGFVLFPGSDHLETVVVFDRLGRRWES